MDKLVAYLVGSEELQIRPAPLERDWMEATDQRYAYRCLPLNIANAHGWEILCPVGFTAVWTGGRGKEAVIVAADPGTRAPALSHFGHGVLTFHVHALFQTDPGTDLFVTGPLNRPKDAIGPLTGIVETDWAPFSFTMNWLFTRRATSVRFEKGEPFCHIFPLARGALEGIQPQIRRIEEAPDLERGYRTWAEGRTQFNADLAAGDQQAQREKWQKAYFRGEDPSGATRPATDHRSKLRLKPFSRR